MIGTEAKIRYMQFTPEDGHKDLKVDESEALKLINKGMKKGRYIVVVDEDGESITSADACDAKLPDKKDAAKKAFKQRVTKKLKGKKVKSIKEIMPVMGG